MKAGTVTVKNLLMSDDFTEEEKADMESQGFYKQVTLPVAEAVFYVKNCLSDPRGGPTHPGQGVSPAPSRAQKAFPRRGKTGENAASKPFPLGGRWLPLGAPARAQRSGSCGERTSSGVNEACRLRRAERYAACEDEVRRRQNSMTRRICE